ncbi:xanthotoxin 5-hydroxylase CYP82C2 isoform X2 [Cryptomeria japonica]|uniref:xanthotoxin 5-hydroxylase CYP82C2 isoform X2 n=1 Tax=Cryptomeria japonica TaxID=3369 RepID=UPI0027DA299F|nr:xanthotoxin 5-hydroxylase CYP82C2 isoform X2 [Cryptomeria japonica]
MAFEEVSSFGLAVVVAALLLTANFLRRRINKTPPEPPSWPIFGHLLLLSRSKQPIHRLLSSLSECYGPIMQLQLGFRPVLVINSSDLAKECLTTNDKAFASRPLTSVGKHIGYDFKMLGLAPYGSYWRNARKLCTLQLFTPHRIESFRHIREGEISALIRSLFESWEREISPVNMKSRLSDLTSNIMMLIVASKRFSPDLSREDFQEVQYFKEIMEETVLLMGTFDIAHYLPFLKWVDPQAIVLAMKNLQKKREVFMKKLLQDHREKRGMHARDLIDVLISATENNEFQSDHKDDTAMLIAGAETSAVTIEWALSALIKHPDVLCKAQQELDMQVGRDRLIKESDVNRLKYLQAIVKETLRLYPTAPLLLPHESIEACKVGGYHFPAGTQLLVNVWAIQRDASVWERPTEFDPERFVNSGKEIDVKGQDFKLIPFGSGRRVCPGISLALIVVTYTLGRLLQSFEWFAPEGTVIDMAEGLGITMPKSIPLEVVIKPRLPLHFY